MRCFDTVYKVADLVVSLSRRDKGRKQAIEEVIEKGNAHSQDRRPMTRSAIGCEVIVDARSDRLGRSPHDLKALWAALR